VLEKADRQAVIDRVRERDRGITKKGKKEGRKEGRKDIEQNTYASIVSKCTGSSRCGVEGKLNLFTQCMLLPSLRVKAASNQSTTVMLSRAGGSTYL
jgi:hypothetical protein